MDGSTGPEADLRAQLRLGVVMTGGVSLAVWMGGVALELDRLRRDVPGSAYAELCHLAGLRPVVDIVAGTSAGGLNGTLLASATAWGSDLEDLRGVWLSAADLSSLLRKPGAASPPSLLDGDGYFLGQAQQAIANLRANGTSPTATQAARAAAGLPPVHLTVTSTLMEGSQVRFTDTLGSPVSSTSYLGLYTFSTDGAAAFDQPGVVAQLARAARSSASFPFAFEASRIDSGGGPVDMGPVAEFVAAGEGASTRYVLDGGLVANEPIDQVYDQIRDQPGRGPVRRVICYVSPLSGSDGGAPPPEFGHDAPDLLGVMAGTLLIPREQNIVRQLRAILQRSDDQRALSRARAGLTIDATTAPDLLRAAEALRPVISRQRGWVSLAGRDGDGAETEPTADEAAVEAEGRRVSRRQVLLLVQDLLRRSITRAEDDDLVALAAQRDAVSSVLASSLDGDDPVRDTVAGAFEVLAVRIPSIVARVQASPRPDRPVEILALDLADLQALVGAAQADGATGPDAPWRAVRALDVLLTASSSSVAPNPQRIDLVQLSANAPNCFDGRSTPDTKLTGVQFNHFGAFYRGGWRANDWMWGRLDGAMRIIEMLVDPDTLLATGASIPDLAEQLFAIAAGPTTSPDHAWLLEQPTLAGGAAAIEALLTAVADPASDDHKRAAALARQQIGRMVAARVQLQIVREELRHVRTYVAADRKAGAASTARDSVFLEAARQLDHDGSAATVVDVFTSCFVGQDRLGDELGSDRMTTLSTQALSVATGAIDEVAAVRGLGVVRPALGALRWTFRLAHGLTSPGFEGSELSKVLVPMISVLAAALMAFAVWDDRSTVLKLGLGLVLAGLSVAALLKSLTSRASVVLTLAAIVVLVAGLVVVTTSWSAGPFVGSALAIVAAAGLAGLVLRRRGAPS